MLLFLDFKSCRLYSENPLLARWAVHNNSFIQLFLTNALKNQLGITYHAGCCVTAVNKADSVPAIMELRVCSAGGVEEVKKILN